MRKKGKNYDFNEIFFAKRSAFSIEIFLSFFDLFL
jgi:hypothetical protein